MKNPSHYSAFNVSKVIAAVNSHLRLPLLPPSDLTLFSAKWHEGFPMGVGELEYHSRFQFQRTHCASAIPSFDVSAGTSADVCLVGPPVGRH